ncbi:hypothetical protein CRG98_040600 [Punica granatum]|uniref:Uncharacterized protein n=1 Tax=Punica granatum TaxID=22663 RepID=A0A2I0I4V4_PUNGR|nr:hypothetical protein CRG98_040600 [Punica granatum]
MESKSPYQALINYCNAIEIKGGGNGGVRVGRLLGIHNFFAARTIGRQSPVNRVTDQCPKPKTDKTLKYGSSPVPLRLGRGRSGERSHSCIPEIAGTEGGAWGER